jgi:hypothetical protein
MLFEHTCLGVIKNDGQHNSFSLTEKKKKKKKNIFNFLKNI